MYFCCVCVLCARFFLSLWQVFFWIKTTHTDTSQGKYFTHVAMTHSARKGIYSAAAASATWHCVRWQLIVDFFCCVVSETHVRGAWLKLLYFYLYRNANSETNGKRDICMLGGGVASAVPAVMWLMYKNVESLKCSVWFFFSNVKLLTFVHIL